MNAPPPISVLDLKGIEDLQLGWWYKGLPNRAFGSRLGDIGTLDMSVLREEVMFPAALLKLSAIEHNRQWMRRFLELEGVAICPHGKTTMAPQLFDLQLRDGAWGLTAATVGHLRIYRAHGVKRILFANQLVATADIEYVVDEIERDAEFDFFCLVDSIAALERLKTVVTKRAPRRPLQVLLEVGIQGGRTGVRTRDEALLLGRQIASCAPEIALRGIEAFEGVLGGYDYDAIEPSVNRMFDDIVALSRHGDAEGWFAPGGILLTAGGSAFFDLAALVLKRANLGRAVRVILRSGCYLIHDSQHYDAYFERMLQRAPSLATVGGALRAALEICAYVQSTPEPALAIASFGKRDASYDIAMPVPLWWYRPGLHSYPEPLGGRCQVTSLNDQHAYVRCPTQDPRLKVGDLIGFGISHPCTTMDKWPLLLVVDDDYRVVSAVRTFF